MGMQNIRLYNVCEAISPLGLTYIKTLMLCIIRYMLKSAFQALNKSKDRIKVKEPALFLSLSVVKLENPRKAISQQTEINTKPHK